MGCIIYGILVYIKECFARVKIRLDRNEYCKKNIIIFLSKSVEQKILRKNVL